LGIDQSHSNIHENVDGACARYLNAIKTYNRVPAAFFLQGNSQNNIRDGTAFLTPKDQEIARALFGEGPKDENRLGTGVYKQYGIVKDGFHVSSCQFAFHYFWESKTALHQFLGNVSECTKLGGYFIGTCFDGQTIFERLKNISEGENIHFSEKNEKLFELEKMYSQTDFPADESCLGYKIKVYQITIGKPYIEYLVHYEYLEQMMRMYGFEPITREEAQKMGLPNGNGMFSELFTAMSHELKKHPHIKKYKNAAKMNDLEKEISFWNKYFIFQKRGPGLTKKQEFQKGSPSPSSPLPEDDPSLSIDSLNVVAASPKTSMIAASSLDIKKKKLKILG
jgi:hypothetical protein